jgi:hypothetical protein
LCDTVRPDLRRTVIQTLTWQTLLLQVLLSTIPALGVLAATFITLRHQRKSKSDELSAAATLKARELMFALYEKRLDDLVAMAEALSVALGEMQAAASIDPGKEKVHAATSRFFSVLYAQTLKLPEFIAETEAELAGLGLSAKFEDKLNYVSSSRRLRTRRTRQNS